MEEGSFSSDSFSMGSNSEWDDEGETHSHSINYDTTGIEIDSDGLHTHTVQGSQGSTVSNRALYCSSMKSNTYLWFKKSEQ